jgi:outer membrane receptor protein involved in Fe transport
MPARTHLIGLAIFLLNTLLSSSAQAADAACCTIRGTVSAQGAPVAAAAVQLESIVGDLVATVSSDPDGAFSFRNVPVGRYRLAVSAAGYVRTVSPAFTVAGDRAETVDLALRARSTSSIATIGSVSVNEVSGLSTSSTADTTIANSTYVNSGSFQIEKMLAQVPGVTIEQVEKTPAGGEAILNIRGVGSSSDLLNSTGAGAADEVLVLQDGQPLIAGNFGAYDLSSLTPAIYGRVELVEGTGGTVLYGTPAIGGVLNLVTRDPLPSAGGDVTVSVGNRGTADFNVLASDRLGRFSYIVDLHRYGTSGYLPPDLHPSIVNVFDPTLPGLRYDLKQGFNVKSALFKARYDLSPVTSLTVGTSLENDYHDESGTAVSPLLGPSGQPLTDPSNGAPAYTAFIGTGALTHVQPKETIELASAVLGGEVDVRAYEQQLAQDLTFVDSPFEPPGAYFDLSNVDRLGGVLASYSKTFGDDTLTLSATANADRAVTTTITQAATGQPRSFAVDNASSLIERTYAVRDDFRSRKLTISGAIFASDYDTLDLRRIDPRAGAVYRPDRTSVVRFSAGTGFAPPIVANLTAPLLLQTGNQNPLPQCPASDPDCGAAEGNPALRAESAFGVDAGYERSVFGSGRVSADLYRTDVVGHIYDTIQAAPAGLKFDDGTDVLYIQRPVNVGNVRYEGFALGATIPVASDLWIDGNYTTAVAKASAVDSLTEAYFQNIVNGEQLEGIPLHTFGSTGRYENRRGIKAALQWLFTGVNNQFGQPGFSVFNANVSVPLGAQSRAARSSLIFAVRNIFDTHDQFYYTNFGIPYGGFSGPYPTAQYGIPPLQAVVTFRRSFGAFR